jgi:hypothetical protein
MPLGASEAVVEKITMQWPMPQTDDNDFHQQRVHLVLFIFGNHICPFEIKRAVI